MVGVAEVQTAGIGDGGGTGWAEELEHGFARVAQHVGFRCHRLHVAHRCGTGEDAGAGPLAALDEAGFFERGEGLADRGAADVELVGQRGLGRQAATNGIVTGLDAPAQFVGDVDVERLSRHARQSHAGSSSRSRPAAITVRNTSLVPSPIAINGASR